MMFEFNEHSGKQFAIPENPFISRSHQRRRTFTKGKKYAILREKDVRVRWVRKNSALNGFRSFAIASYGDEGGRTLDRRRRDDSWVQPTTTTMRRRRKAS